MKPTTRALRRHHLSLKKAKWRRRPGLSMTPGDLQRRACIRATTSTPCSCWMCGNPRTHFRELSRQERSSDQLQRLLRGALDA